MATMYGRINQSETTFGENTFHKNQALTSASNGVSLVQIRRNDKTVASTDASPLSVSGSHWSFVHNFFYRSGSAFTGELNKYNEIYHSFNQHTDLKPFHKNKFADSGSVLYIPQQYFGERIQPGSFEFTIRTGSADNTTRQIIIKDDKNGNLFSSNANISRSGATSISSSDNYIGNIYYDLGVAVLTETASALHTPSTASFTVKSMLTQSIAASNHFFITGSDEIPIKFISTASVATETDTATIKFFASASTLADTVASASKKINVVFNNNHIIASASATTLHLTNDANQLTSRITSNAGINLGPISGAGAFITHSGFGGGLSAVKYTDIGGAKGRQLRNYGFYNVKFNSTTPVFTSQYSIKIPSSAFNVSMNPTVRIPVSGSISSGSSVSTFANLKNDLTGSGWSPYFNQVQLFRDKTGEEPILVANLPRAVQKRDDIDLIITFRVDH